MKKYYILAGLVSTMLLMACSNEDESTKRKEEANIGFSIEEMPYNSDVEITRAGASNLISKDTVSINNDIEAEVRIERDPIEKKAAITRANPLSNDTYTIYATQGGSRVNNSTMKGTVTGGTTFTPVSGSTGKIKLPAGNYTFVCGNSSMTDNGTSLSTDYANVENSRIGITSATIGTSRYHVAFQMKHTNARLRLKMVSYMPISGITATLTSISNQPKENTYTADGSSYTTTTSQALSNSYTFANNTTAATDHSYTSLTDYQYFMAGTNGAQLKVTFNSGSMYIKPLAGSSYTLDKLGTMAANGSYTVSIRLLYKTKYLFQDGTVDTYFNRGTRTPIGVVVKDNDGTPGSGIAMAMNVADFINRNNPQFSVYKEYPAPLENTERNATTYPESLGINDMEGYRWTYSPSPNGDIKANDANRYSAYYAAAHYTPNITVTGLNVGKWYLPALGEWWLALNGTLKLHPGFGYVGPSSPAAHTKEELQRAQAIFFQTGNEGIDLPRHWMWLWSSTQFNAIDNQPAGNSYRYCGFIGLYDSWSMRHHNGQSYPMNVIPFVHF